MTNWHRILLACAACGLAGVAFADTLVLKNGTRVEGTFMGGDARAVRFDDGQTVRHFPVGQVRSIEFDSASETSEARPSEARSSDGRPYETRASEGMPENSAPRRRAQDRPSEAEAAAPPESSLEVPGGTPITVRMIDAVDSRSAQLGQTFAASVDEPVNVGGQTVIPRGADVVVKLVEDQQSGRIAGQTSLGLALASIRVNGRMVDFTSEEVREHSGSRGARSGKIIGGGTALGAILGGIAGGGRGAAIGAASGAAVGTGAEVATKGERVRVPSETRLSFRTSNPVRI
jgi:hypothetical protein